MDILFQNICKSYGNVKVLRDINLQIPSGKLVVFIGHSGSGKTTCLRLINRLAKPTSGKIYIDGEDTSLMNGAELRRHTGYVIQHIGLIPHMTIGENIELVPKLLKWTKQERTERTAELMELVKLPFGKYAHRYPHELSGGQQQRVGVARALAAKPEIVLMDEPFSALDPIARSDLQDELRQIQSQLKRTIVFVTHDMDEALKLADLICIVHKGQVLQYAKPEEILNNPANEYVEQFIGKYRLYSGAGAIPELADVIATPIFGKPDMTAAEALIKMRRNNVDSLIVAENDTYCGVARIWGIQKHYKDNLPLSEMMEKTYPVVKDTDSTLDAVNLIKERNLSVIPVLGPDRRVLGVITRSSLTEIITDFWPSEETYA